ncbi:hypothetical protein HXX76_011900 [Chlamydomonas incerta]|uniref:Cyclic nucleotide-binding domain-containing protein n=1 Tax=Chlamydomonas incerta TaxID=51695 RepID=A0A835SWQ5_CHLIN|nr:hypothetical protein HXX76_011900 [Chlamydomonas incerta]|eukprot:KAG2428220.1 hypothetical protein HXX76_011900 [Chlamydomonas incerta]
MMLENGQPPGPTGPANLDFIHATLQNGSEKGPQKANLGDVSAWLQKPPEARTSEQVSAIATLLTLFPKLREAGQVVLTVLVQQLRAEAHPRGKVLWRQGEPPAAAFLLLGGGVVLSDAGKKRRSSSNTPLQGEHHRAGGSGGGADDPGGAGQLLQHCTPGDVFGDEALLAGIRRPCRAVVESEVAVVAEVPRELFNATVGPAVRGVYGQKVEFLAGLPVFGKMPRRVVERLAPAFFPVSHGSKEVLCRQGDAADCLWAIVTGRCHVVLDPRWRAELATRPPDTDPRRTTQVASVQMGQLIGDMAVIGNMRRRTATVRCATDVLLYRLQRHHFLRLCPPQQLEELRAIGEAKMLMLVRAAAEEHGAAHARSRVLSGRDLRELQPRYRAQALRELCAQPEPSSVGSSAVTAAGGGLVIAPPATAHDATASAHSSRPSRPDSPAVHFTAGQAGVANAGPHSQAPATAATAATALARAASPSRRYAVVSPAPPQPPPPPQAIAGAAAGAADGDDGEGEGGGGAGGEAAEEDVWGPDGGAAGGAADGGMGAVEGDAYDPPPAVLDLDSGKVVPNAWGAVSAVAWAWARVPLAAQQQQAVALAAGDLAAAAAAARRLEAALLDLGVVSSTAATAAAAAGRHGGEEAGLHADAHGGAVEARPAARTTAGRGGCGGAMVASVSGAEVTVATHEAGVPGVLGKPPPLLSQTASPFASPPASPQRRLPVSPHPAAAYPVGSAAQAAAGEAAQRQQPQQYVQGSDGHAYSYAYVDHFPPPPPASAAAAAPYGMVELLGEEGYSDDEEEGGPGAVAATGAAGLGGAAAVQQLLPLVPLRLLPLVDFSWSIGPGSILHLLTDPHPSGPLYEPAKQPPAAVRAALSRPATAASASAGMGAGRGGGVGGSRMASVRPLTAALASSTSAAAAHAASRCSTPDTPGPWSPVRGAQQTTWSPVGRATAVATGTSAAVGMAAAAHGGAPAPQSVALSHQLQPHPQLQHSQQPHAPSSATRSMGHIAASDEGGGPGGLLISQVPASPTRARAASPSRAPVYAHVLSSPQHSQPNPALAFPGRSALCSRGGGGGGGGVREGSARQQAVRQQQEGRWASPGGSSSQASRSASPDLMLLLPNTAAVTGSIAVASADQVSPAPQQLLQQQQLLQRQATWHGVTSNDPYARARVGGDPTALYGVFQRPPSPGSSRNPPSGHGAAAPHARPGAQQQPHPYQDPIGFSSGSGLAPQAAGPSQPPQPLVLSTGGGLRLQPVGAPAGGLSVVPAAASAAVAAAVAASASAAAPSATAGARRYSYSSPSLAPPLAVAVHQQAHASAQLPSPPLKQGQSLSGAVGGGYSPLAAPQQQQPAVRQPLSLLSPTSRPVSALGSPGGLTSAPVAGGGPASPSLSHQQQHLLPPRQQQRLHSAGRVGGNGGGGPHRSAHSVPNAATAAAAGAAAAPPNSLAACLASPPPLPMLQIQQGGQSWGVAPVSSVPVHTPSAHTAAAPASGARSSVSVSGAAAGGGGGGGGGLGGSSASHKAVLGSPGWWAESAAAAGAAAAAANAGSAGNNAAASRSQPAGGGSSGSSITSITSSAAAKPYAPKSASATALATLVASSGGGGGGARKSLPASVKDPPVILKGGLMFRPTVAAGRNGGTSNASALVVSGAVGNGTAGAAVARMLQHQRQQHQR